MKIFIGWITIQLIIIGVIQFNIANDISRGRFQCPAPSNASTFTATIDGAFLPLAAFLPSDPEINNYCNPPSPK